MNVLNPTKQAQVISCLVERNSIRATVRTTRVAKNTVVKLLCDLGRACSEYQDMTPAMEAGITDHVWSLEEIIKLLDSK